MLKENDPFKFSAARWVELLSDTDTLAVLDRYGNTVCVVKLDDKRDISFEFQRGVSVTNSAVGVLVKPEVI